MIQTAEQAIEALRQLSPTERKKFYDWFYPWIEEERRKELVEEEKIKQELKDKN